MIEALNSESDVEAAIASVLLIKGPDGLIAAEPLVQCDVGDCVNDTSSD